MESSYDKMSNEEYHSDNGYISSSQIKEILKNPDCSTLRKKVTSNKYMDMGTVLHSAFLEPENFDDDIKIYQDKKTKGFLKKEFSHATVISRKMYDNCKYIIDKVYPDIKMKNDFTNEKIFSGGIAEKSYFTELEGVKCKARPDYLYPTEAIDDLKTTSTKISGDSQILKWIINRGAHISAAFYLDIINKVDGTDIKLFNIYFVHTLSCKHFRFNIPEDMIEEGRVLYKKALKIYKNHLNGKSNDDIIKDIF